MSYGVFIYRKETVEDFIAAYPKAKEILEDDKKMYPSYRAGTVVRSEILSKYPELKAVLEKLNNILDDKTMADLNYQVESEGKKPEDVAREYLQEKGLLEVKQ